MITLKINGQVFTITNGNCISGKEGIEKKFLKACIGMIRFEYQDPSDGFWEPYLYIKLANVKAVELVSCDFVFPPHNDNVVY